MKMKMKNRSHRYHINRPRFRHGHKCSKCEKCFSMMMLIHIKQNLNNIWSSMHESCHHIETSQLICKANQLTGFYMMATLPFNELSNTEAELKKSVA